MVKTALQNEDRGEVPLGPGKLTSCYELERRPLWTILVKKVPVTQQLTTHHKAEVGAALTGTQTPGRARGDQEAHAWSSCVAGRGRPQTTCPRVLGLVRAHLLPQCPLPISCHLPRFSFISNRDHKRNTLQKTGHSDIWGICCILNWGISADCDVFLTQGSDGHMPEVCVVGVLVRVVCTRCPGSRHIWGNKWFKNPGSHMLEGKEKKHTFEINYTMK